MSDRKVLNKYYDPNYDPEKLPKKKQPKDKQDDVTMMLPMTIRCNTCGNYIGKGTKFNMRKETCLDEKYLELDIYRFYLKCRDCCTEITFKTDPKNHDYVVEHGAKRTYEPRKDEEQTELALQEMRENEEEGNAMKMVENRANILKREIEMAEDLDEMKEENKRKAQVTHEQLLEALHKQDEEKEAENEEAAKEMFRSAKERKLEEEEEKRRKELQIILNANKKSQGASKISPEKTQVKKSGLNAKIGIKPKKVKTEEQSLDKGQVNLLGVSKDSESKSINIAANLCSYSDEE